MSRGTLLEWGLRHSRSIPAAELVAMVGNKRARGEAGGSVNSQHSPGKAPVLWLAARGKKIRWKNTQLGIRRDFSESTRTGYKVREGRLWVSGEMKAAIAMGKCTYVYMAKEKQRVVLMLWKI